ncbi:MAG: Chromosomal replication initiator protein DnaA [Candidatus Anoxychlamydiales bacterium]|nr:Chromosomal replication initiator protein DnaA [Candidatus Anoxychlamydiales bacterium]NGX36692.1 Chromosomal replication initiator protein DnaA [Candidatus Anoxychlamydiales bacterium]
MKAWTLFLQDLEKTIGVSTTRKWLYSLKILKFDAWNLYLEAENHFQAKWFEEHIRPIIMKGFYNENFHKIKIHLSVKNLQKPTKIKTEKPFQIVSDSLDTYLSFPFFIASDKNLMTLKLLKEASQKGISFNPIFLFGQKGSGKTHLLQACAQLFIERNLKTFFVNAQTFTSHVVDAIRKGSMQEFRKTYRNLDVLIIDDIQILANKFATQEEFFHTFNTLHSENKTILISSNVAPNAMDNIESRLISRFEWGISLFLEKLEKKELKLVVKSQSSLLNIELDQKVEKFILENFKSIRSIKKALKTLLLKSHLENSFSFDLNSVKKHLSHLIEEENITVLNHDKIVHEVSIYFGLTTKDVLGKSQTRECTLPRQFSMYLCRELLKMPFMKIGNIFKRDHSTVMTSVKTIKKNLETKEIEIYSAFVEVTKKLNTHL